MNTNLTIAYPHLSQIFILVAAFTKDGFNVCYFLKVLSPAIGIEFFFFLKVLSLAMGLSQGREPPLRQCLSPLIAVCVRQSI